MSGLCQDTSLRAPFLLNSRKVLQFASMSQLTTKQPEWERKIIVKKVDCIMVDPWEFLVRILKVHPSICLCASWMTACEAIRYMYLLNIAESFFLLNGVRRIMSWLFCIRLPHCCSCREAIWLFNFWPCLYTYYSKFHPEVIGSFGGLGIALMWGYVSSDMFRNCQTIEKLLGNHHKTLTTVGFTRQVMDNDK